MSYLLDTNILPEIVRKRPHPGVTQRIGSCRRHQLATSSVCVLELRYGALRGPNGQQLWERITQDVLSQVRILPVGEDEAVRAGEILAHLAADGETIELEDVLIGATALTRGLIMVTRNLRHFSRIPDLAVESWHAENEADAEEDRRREDHGDESDGASG